MKCPHCGEHIDLPESPAALLGSIKTQKKAASSKANGKLGGRPRAPRRDQVFTLADWNAKPRSGSIFLGVSKPYIKFKDGSRADISPDLASHIRSVRKQLKSK